MNERLPLIALHSLLCPGGRLSLQVFEPRYLDMVAACLREGREFGVCLIRHGQEVGEAAEIYPEGSAARVVDWMQLPNGLLGLTVEGGRRFRAEALRVEPDRLLTGAPRWIEDEAELPWRERDRLLANLLVALARHPQAEFSLDDGRLYDPVWLSWRLLERLPLLLEQKQEVLAIAHAYDRLDTLHALVERHA